MRFLTAMVCLGHGRYRLDGVPRMRERPIGDLLDGASTTGCAAVSEAEQRLPAGVIEADGLAGGRVRIRGDVSSQFLSGLLMAAPSPGEDVVIEIDGPLVSWPYVEMTLRMMDDWGAAGHSKVGRGASSTFTGRQAPGGEMVYRRGTRRLRRQLLLRRGGHHRRGDRVPWL